MTNSTKTTNDQPPFRLACSKKKGVDNRGRDVLGYPVPIGSVWPRKDETKGYRIDLELTPAELATDQAVLFLFPIDQQNQTVESNPITSSPQDVTFG